ncbi:glycoside hydrolase family 113 [Flavobacterium frigoris]|uniref:Glycoside hydrolase n=1 Tax=Flavobacterium frigoris (strain PS1) TaxID=1086011 RepID=H7FS56_FLAFP|nr:hypothetical protein [Flavobacterium frigoris]EIA08553.1 hypothetical protein HJ01_02275 [Flavobacterium frigoris PS1]
MKKQFLVLLLLFILIISGYAFYNNKDKDKFAEKRLKPTVKIVAMEYKGMNLVAPIKELKNSTLENLKENHVNAISLIPYAFANIDNASVNYNNDRQWWGEKTEGIIASNKMAHDYKMTVMLKPHLWINHNFYTGHLDFATEKEWQHWEADYEKYILDFAQLAQKEKIELFCFGTELGNSVAKRPEYWNQLIQKIKKIYTGKLTYAANWDDFDKVPFWNQLDYIGIDGYFPLSNAENPSVEELNEGWIKHIQKMDLVQKKFNKKILFTEFGYRNSNHATEEPWVETKNEINNLAQANAYESLFQSMTQKEWFVGGFAWKWYADDYHKQPKNSIDYTPQEKPALETIKRWYN